MLAHEFLELGNDVNVQTKGELGLDEFLAARDAQLLEAGDGGLCERLICEVSKWWAAPQDLGLAQLLGGGRRIGAVQARPGSLVETLTDARVEFGVGKFST